MKKRKKPGLKFGSHQVPRIMPITLAKTPWDMGADGPANQRGLKTEPATDIDPETGRETPNPNGVIRRRRTDRLAAFLTGGIITREQWAVAVTLRDASQGKKDGDPLAAIFIDAFQLSDPEAARFDARRLYREMMAYAPKDTVPVIERVIAEELPIWRNGQAQRIRHIERLRRGLTAIHEKFGRRP